MTRVTPLLHDAHPVTTGAATTPDPRETTAVTDNLTDRQTAILEFEARWYEWTGAKATRVADTFGVTIAEYNRELEQTLALDAALAHDDMLVKRLRRQAPQRAKQTQRQRRARHTTTHRGPLYGPDGLYGRGGAA